MKQFSNSVCSRRTDQTFRLQIQQLVTSHENRHSEVFTINSFSAQLFKVYSSMFKFGRLHFPFLKSFGNILINKMQKMLIPGETARYEPTHLDLYCLQTSYLILSYVCSQLTSETFQNTRLSTQRTEKIQTNAHAECWGSFTCDTANIMKLFWWKTSL